MPQGPSTPNPDMSGALEHYQTAQSLTLQLYAVIQSHRPSNTEDTAVDKLLKPLQAALTIHGNPAQTLSKLKEALEGGSTPDNILQLLINSPNNHLELEQALRAYGQLLKETGDLTKLIRLHELALDLAQAPAYQFEMDPNIRGGKPCFRGRRISVYDIMEYLASGMTAEEIVSDFPDLTTQDVQQCQAFATEFNTRMKQLPLE